MCRRKSTELKDFTEQTPIGVPESTRQQPEASIREQKSVGITSRGTSKGLVISNEKMDPRFTLSLVRKSVGCLNSLTTFIPDETREAKFPVSTFDPATEEVWF